MKETVGFMADGPSTPEDLFRPTISTENRDNISHTGRVHRARPPHHGPDVKAKFPPGIAPTTSSSEIEAKVAQIQAGLQHQIDSGVPQEYSHTQPHSPISPVDFANLHQNVLNRNEQKNNSQNLDKSDNTIESLTHNESTTHQSKELPANELSQQVRKLIEQQIQKGNYSPEEKAQLNEILTSGRFNSFEVRNAFIRDGKLIFGVYDQKEKLAGNLAFRELKHEGVGVYPNPDPTEVNTVPKAEAWVEDRIRDLEAGAEIESVYEQNLIATINSSIPFRNRHRELNNRVRARVRYHNTNIAAVYAPEKFSNGFNNIYAEQHKEILDTLGVRAAIQELDFNNGEYYRIDNGTAAGRAAKAAREVLIKQHLCAAMGIAIPAPGAAFDDKVERAFELGEKTMNIFGISAQREGVVDNAGGTHVFDLPEDNAEYMINHLGDINADTNLRGGGASEMRNLMYFPVFLSKSTNLNSGRFSQLRKYCNLYITSAQKFDIVRDRGKPSEQAVYEQKSTLNDLFTSATSGLREDRERLAVWANTISQAAQASQQFAEKGGESILNNPLPGANEVKHGNKGASLPKALGNYDKLSGSAYPHISGDRKQHAMTHWLEGLLEWSNSSQARSTNILGWNKFIQQEIVVWARDTGRINEDNKELIQKHLRLNAWGWQIPFDVIPDAARGGWSVIKWFYTQIYRFKG